VSTVENLDGDGASPLLLSEVEEINRFFDDLNDESVRLLLDVGHAKVSAQTFGVKAEDYFERLASLIEMLHLSDNDGQHDTNRPFDETVWFGPHIKDFSSKPWVIEVYRLSLEQMFEQRRVLNYLDA
jgi:uncharacterized protein (UPF0276 family)